MENPGAYRSKNWQKLQVGNLELLLSELSLILMDALSP